MARVTRTTSGHRDLQQLGYVLRTARLERGLKQIEVAQGAGLSESQVSEIETGKANPTWLQLRRLVVLGLGATMSEIVLALERPPS